jgi:hypothetical protein
MRGFPGLTGQDRQIPSPPEQGVSLEAVLGSPEIGETLVRFPGFRMVTRLKNCLDLSCVSLNPIPMIFSRPEAYE